MCWSVVMQVFWRVSTRLVVLSFCTGQRFWNLAETAGTWSPSPWSWSICLVLIYTRIIVLVCYFCEIKSWNILFALCFLLGVCGWTGTRNIQAIAGISFCHRSIFLQDLRIRFWSWSLIWVFLEFCEWHV